MRFYINFEQDIFVVEDNGVYYLFSKEALDFLYRGIPNAIDDFLSRSDMNKFRPYNGFELTPDYVEIKHEM